MLTVQQPHEIALDIPGVTLPDGSTKPALGVVRFPTVGPIRPSLISVFPQKMVTGDFSRSTEQVASSHTFESFTGGAGVLVMNPAEEADRFWDSSLNTLFRNQVTLNWQPLDTGRGDAPANSQARVGVVLGPNLYVVFDTHIKQFQDNSKSWGADMANLPAAATDAAVLGSTAYLAFGSGISSSTNGTVWTNDLTHTADYLQVWDSRLWTISKDGTNFRSYDGTTWVSGATRPDMKVPLGDVTGLTTFYQADNTEAIYAMTKAGPYIWDDTGSKWRRAKARIPRQRGSGKAFTVFRDTLFMGSGMAVDQFTGQVQSPIGLDKGWGLPNYLNGQIVSMTESSSLLISLVDSTKSAPISVNGAEFSSATVPGWGSSVFFKAQGYSSVWGFNGQGWHNLWKSSATGTGATWVMVVDAYNDTRLYVGADNRVYMIRIPDGNINPLQQAVLPYAASGELITPWFDAQWSELDKVAIRLQAKTAQMSATETATFYYGIDDSENWTSLGVMNTNGYLNIDFVQKLGQPFKNIRFRVVLQRGTDVTKTPVVKFGVVKYLKILEPMFGYTATLNFEQDYGDQTPGAMVAAIEQAMRAKTILPFAYRDLLNTDQTRYVRVSHMTGSQLGGDDPRGRYDVSFIEV